MDSYYWQFKFMDLLVLIISLTEFYTFLIYLIFVSYIYEEGQTVGRNM